VIVRLVALQVKAGGTYQGIFHTAQLENSELHVVLYMAKLIKDAEQQPVDGSAARRPIKELIIKSADLVSLTAKDIRMGADDVSRPAEDAFSTDTAISRGRGGYVQWLQTAMYKSAKVRLLAGL